MTILHKAFRSAAHARLVELLREARLKAGLTQADVADKLGKPQSFVAKIEPGERRLDVVEFMAVAAAIRIDPAKALSALMSESHRKKSER